MAIIIIDDYIVLNWWPNNFFIVVRIPIFSFFSACPVRINVRTVLGPPDDNNIVRYYLLYKFMEKMDQNYLS